LNDSRVSKRGPRGGFRLRRPQVVCWKGHSKNKCSRVSSTCNEQRTHSKEGRAIFFRRNMFLVLSLSCKSSQKKTLCLFWAADFQSQRKAGWTDRWPMR
jgi:hypothetical protein